MHNCTLLYAYVRTTARFVSQERSADDVEGQTTVEGKMFERQNDRQRQNVLVFTMQLMAILPIARSGVEHPKKLDEFTDKADESFWKIASRLYCTNQSIKQACNQAL